jgi:hypothetical protein
VRTIGFNRPSPNPLRRRIAAAIAIGLWAGFTIVPLAIFFGWVR